MRYPNFFLNSELGLFILIAVGLLVGLFNATRLGYISKKYANILGIAGILLIIIIYILIN